MEIREIGDDSRLVSVFGRDPSGKQLKCTVLCSDMASCAALKRLVDEATSKL